MKPLRFDGRVAIVTGAGRGPGRAYALLPAARGARVVVNDLPSATQDGEPALAAADEVVEEIRAAGGEAVASYGSVATPDGAASIVQAAIGNYGRFAAVAAWLVHEKCSLNGDMLDSGAGHIFRHILSTTEGYTTLDLTLEDVDANIPAILDDSRTNVWSSVDEALQDRLKKLQAAAADPVDTQYPAASARRPPESAGTLLSAGAMMETYSDVSSFLH